MSEPAAKLLGMDLETNTNDPCTSRDGTPKERWPSAVTAWFVVALCFDGAHGRSKPGKKMYAYHCSNPKCDGWHLASCRNHEDRKRHRRGLEELQRRFPNTKISQRAGKNLRVEEDGLTDAPAEV